MLTTSNTTASPEANPVSASDIVKLGLLAAMWGASFVLMRLAVPETGALLAALLRITIAATVLFILAQIQQIPMHWQRRFKPYALAGLFGAALPFTLLSYAALYLPAALSALLNATCPLFAAFFSMIWLREPLTLGKILSLLLGICGVGLMVTTESPTSEKFTWLALIACLGGPACFAISALVIKLHSCPRRPDSIAPMAMATGSMSLASLIMLPLLPFALPAAMPSYQALGWITVLALLPSALAQIIFIPLIATISPTRAMSVAFLIPLFSLFWGGVVFTGNTSAHQSAGRLYSDAGHGPDFKNVNADLSNSKTVFASRIILFRCCGIVLLSQRQISGTNNMKKTLPCVIHGLGLAAIALTLFMASSISVQAASSPSAQQQLEAAVAGSWRSPQNKVRDKYRHPLQTLTFFGVTPNATLIELLPSGTAWYTEILAPFLHDQGQYIAVNIPGNAEDAGQKQKFAADPAHYGKINLIEITPQSIDFGTPDSADFFLTFRNVHNFAMKGDQAKLFAAIFKVLKPGGVLGVVDHRAEAGKTLAEVLQTGYIPEAFVIAEAEKAGFKLVASSPINNNAKDSKDYLQGVWTLPPTLAEGEKDRKKYLAIGESDRFTLRFIKP